MNAVRLPAITGTSDHEQLQQIKSWLVQLSNQLSMALEQVEGGGNGANFVAPKKESTNFDQVKALLLKSAEVVESLSQQVSHRLQGSYVAASEFGSYREETDLRLEADSTAISQLYTSLESVSGTVDALGDTLRSTSAYIKSGLLEEGVYGLEIGQTNTVDGASTFDRFARFTADRLSFYDNSGAEVAYISDYQLYITNARVSGKLTIGGYTLNAADGLAFCWEGGA